MYPRWVSLLEEEFFRQGDKERNLGLPISPLFDRSKQGITKSQVGPRPSPVAKDPGSRMAQLLWVLMSRHLFCTRLGYPLEQYHFVYLSID